MILALIGPLGLPELIIVLVIIIMIFGAKRLSGLGRGLGQSIKGFKDEMKDVRDEDREELEKDRDEKRA